MYACRIKVPTFSKDFYKTLFLDFNWWEGQILGNKFCFVPYFYHIVYPSKIENLASLWQPHMTGPRERRLFLSCRDMSLQDTSSKGFPKFTCLLHLNRKQVLVIKVRTYFFSSFGRVQRFFFESGIFVICQCSRQIFVARQKNSSFGC